MIAEPTAPAKPIFACSRTECPHDTPCCDAVLERVLDPSPAPVAVVCLADGMIVWRNSAAAALGLVLERALSDVVPGHHASRVSAALAPGSAANVRHRFAIRIADLDMTATFVWPDDPGARRQAVLYLETDAPAARANEVLATIANELTWAGVVPVLPAHIRKSIEGADNLTTRERRVLTMIVAGRTVRSIAAELFVAESTVRNYLSAVYRKLGVTNRTELLEAVFD